MIKAIFLDMDETLCDTTKANILAKDHLTQFVSSHLSSLEQANDFSEKYLQGIYKNLSPDLQQKLFPISDEEAFRTKLVHIFFEQCGANSKLSDIQANEIRQEYDSYRIQQFDFFKDCEKMLKDLREKFTLVVITNGPAYSQQPKVERIELDQHVDHFIIGGLEPEEKPEKSIFNKALNLASVQAHEAIHVGDSVKADIIGANNSGIKSVWINPNKAENEFADFSIEIITQLPEVLRKLNSL